MTPVSVFPEPTIQELVEKMERIERGLVWNPLTLANGFANYNPGFSSGEFARSVDGIVSLRGLLKKAPEAWKLNEIIAELPEGFRPKKQELLSTIGWDNEIPTGMQQYRIDINSTGQIVVVARIGEVGKGTPEKGLINFLSLDNLSFSVN